ncbi:hypothetical protein KIPB_014588, partial [Kipferlia bialata]|eukprot:g14588.t1
MAPKPTTCKEAILAFSEKTGQKAEEADIV